MAVSKAAISSRLVDLFGHQAIRQDPAARELLAHAHQHPEMLAFIRLQHKTPPHHPADTVVDHRLRPRILPRHNPSFSVVDAHGGENTGPIPNEKINFCLKAWLLKASRFSNYFLPVKPKKFILSAKRS
jgi:hypothetical protein